MPKVIASTYEIIKEIGSGGGGIVYLGRHLRLNKQIVLKADKRKLTAKPEQLRREVDALKDLSHTYIPQVYDFVQEDGVVYTVMDYIEGESLDIPLSRGTRFSQPQIIEWACELLEALHYLHSRPPYGILHGDIKPANVMLTPQGDIRLIDFNIALALGEEGAVRVGYSQGYASPEHYGLDYSGFEDPRRTRTAHTRRTTRRREEPATQAEPPKKHTEPFAGGQTERTEPLYGQKSGRTMPTEPLAADGNPGAERMASKSETAQVLLDVRSDIYSLGATLYHLLTGHCPAQDAKNVSLITDRMVSPAVAAIVDKAMAPNPNQRWQTADEMLFAFEHLHETDPRVLRYKRLVRTAAFSLTGLFLIGGLCAFTGLKQIEEIQETAKLFAESAERAAVAVSASEEAYRKGDISTAVKLGVEALSEEGPYAGRSQRALAQALGVYDLSDGFKPSHVITLPAEPLKTVLSPQGTWTAVLTSGQVHVFDTASGKQQVLLPASPSAMADVAFAGEDVLLYAGDSALRCYDLKSGQERWSGREATSVTLSADGSTVAAVNADGWEVVIYNIADGSERRVIKLPGQRRIGYNDSLIDPEDDLFALSGDGTLLAASYGDGGLRVFHSRAPELDFRIFDSSEFFHFEGGFFQQYLAFSSMDENNASIFAVVDLNTGTQTGGFQGDGRYQVKTTETGIFLSYQNVMIKLDPITGDQTEMAYTGQDITAFSVSPEYTAVVTTDNALSFFDSAAQTLERHESDSRRDFIQLAGDYAATGNIDTASIQILALELYPDTQYFSYDPGYGHREARVSEDGETILLFSSDGFRLYRKDGTLLAQKEMPNADEIYDQQYRREKDDSFLEVIYYDGLIHRYSASTGELVSETRGERPDKSLYEEFLTERYRITRPLHGKPTVIDLETGEQKCELAEDAYLTYVTQVEDNIIIEYITIEKERYGLLMDVNCEVLAEFPNLCDVLEDGSLVFDDMRGNLRRSRIYSSQELIALGKSY